MQMNIYSVKFLELQFELKSNWHGVYKKRSKDPKWTNDQLKHPPQTLLTLKKIRLSSTSLSRDEL